jgi:hypothetical protein
MLDRFERPRSDRRVPFAAVIVAVVLFLPARGIGLYADDLTHQSMFETASRMPGGIRGDWDIFCFQSADRRNLRQMMDFGIWPWWTSPSIRLAFFRPLASLSHALDYRVIHLPWVMHAESLVLCARRSPTTASCSSPASAPSASSRSSSPACERPRPPAREARGSSAACSSSST